MLKSFNILSPGCYLHAQLVKLDFELKAVQPAWQGLKYVRPLFPQTGSTSVIRHSQPKLQAAVKFTWNGSGAALVLLLKYGMVVPAILTLSQPRNISSP